MKHHSYTTHLHWTGNDGEGTKTYKGYRRDFTILSARKPILLGSSDPAFRGDPTRYNPEEMLVASVSSCHMLWYLHLCAVNNVIVVHYEDAAAGVMRENPDGSGAFERIDLNPTITLAPESDSALALALHHEAHEKCFIANSVNFPIHLNPTIGQPVSV